VDPELGDRPIVFQRSGDEEEEQCDEEVENVGEASNEEEDENDDNEEDDDNEEQSELEHVTRQIRRSHVAPTIVPAWEDDRVMIKPFVISKYIFDLFSLFDSIHDVHFFVYCLSVPGTTTILMEEVTRDRLTSSLVTSFDCTTREL
jgi:hypothetical protein